LVEFERTHGGARRRATAVGAAQTAWRTLSVSARCACSGGRSRALSSSILIFAAAVSLGLSEWVDAAIILAIVIGSTLLGFYQEYRASAAVEELKKRLALTCRVVRDGVEGTVRADALVPGDVLVLSAG
jgi:magnesium-transporting ATPase (P-type)